MFCVLSIILKGDFDFGKRKEIWTVYILGNMKIAHGSYRLKNILCNFLEIVWLRISTLLVKINQKKLQTASYLKEEKRST